MRTDPVSDVRRVVLDGSGGGSVSFGPQRPNTRWLIQLVSVSVSTNTNEPTARITRGGLLVTATYSGSLDTDSDVKTQWLYPGELLTCTWTGGDPGAQAAISFSGIQESER